jgi:hypothetical protein
MAAAAQPHSTPYLTPRRGASLPGATYRTAVLTTLFVLAGALLISIMMTVAMLLAGPPRTWDGAPLSQPLPQPSAAYGLDL